MVVGSGRSVALTAGGVSSPAVALAQFLELVEERGLAVPGEALREFIEAGEKMISEQFDNEGRIDPRCEFAQFQRYVLGVRIERCGELGVCA
jgi:hypothetical protein